MNVPIQQAGKWFRFWARNYREHRLVSLSRIRATQETVTAGRVAFYLKRKRWPAVRLFHLPDGLWAVDDGHHRLTAAVMLGKRRIWAHLDYPEQTQ